MMKLLRLCLLVMLLLCNPSYAGVNNPGNLITSSVKWRGAFPCTGRFVCFLTKTAGLRALVVNLRTYIKHYKLTTIKQIITRWAPPHENDTKNYYLFVSRRVEVSPTARIRFTSGVLYKLVVAIIKMEKGYVDYNPKEIQNMIDKVFRL